MVTCTGRWFGVEHHDAVPDVITFGKGIGGGVLPLSGMVTTRAIREVVGGAPNGFSSAAIFSSGKSFVFFASTLPEFSGAPDHLIRADIAIHKDEGPWRTTPTIMQQE